MAYNGWKNRETWNVALWMGNDEPLYRSAVDFMRRYKGAAPYMDWVRRLSLAGKTTKDGVRWDGGTLDYPRLNEMMNDFRPEA